MRTEGAAVGRKVLCIIGTRPEVIKMAPVIRALRGVPGLAVSVLSSGQHRDLLAPLINWFELCVDADMRAMTQNQSLAELTARLMRGFAERFSAARPDLVLAQGDTTTVMCAALTCFYLDIPFGHIEAGLRTFDPRNPFPEEFNRVAVSRLAQLHFCPTARARENIVAEHVDPAAAHLTGNTVIDALHYTVAKLGIRGLRAPEYDILLTAHRREHFGPPLVEICRALLDLCREFPHLRVLYPMHPNPNVRSVAIPLLAGRRQITLVEPLDYPELVAAMQGAKLILTDSGGIQEEAPALGKPVLVLRTVTERPEAVEIGAAKLVGPERLAIVDEARRLLTDRQYYASMARGGLPYGDGHAARRIRDIVCRFFQTRSRVVTSLPAAPRARLLNAQFDALTLQQTVDAIFRRLARRERAWLCTVNVAVLMTMRADARLQSFVDRAALVVADGQPLVWCASWFGQRLPERVTGIDLIDAVCERAARKGKRVFLLGARPEIIARAAYRLRQRHGGLQLDYADGYFAGEQAAARAEQIRASGAEILFVGMGVPRQENFIEEQWQRLGVGMAIGVGGSFDVLAGVRARAPVWMRKIGMEWFFRMVQEPRRLFNRYRVTNSQFILAVLQELLRTP